MNFMGYKRPDGSVGIRNHVLILPGCACASETCRVVASQVSGAVNIINNSGCAEVKGNEDMTQKILVGFAANPNVYGVVVIGLGCENVSHSQLRESILKVTNKPVVSFGIQEEGGTLKTIEKAVRVARQMVADASRVTSSFFWAGVRKIAAVRPLLDLIWRPLLTFSRTVRLLNRLIF